MKKDIYILIVENETLARNLINQYFDKDNITYAEMVEAEKRPRIVELLEKIESPETWGKVSPQGI